MDFFVALFILASLLEKFSCYPLNLNGKNAGYSRYTLDYLQNYGYLQSQNAFTPLENSAIVKATLRFQTFVSIPASGLLTTQTQNLMTAPRCAEVDININNVNNNNNQSLSVLQTNKTELTYSIQSWATRFNRTIQNETIWRAVKTWESMISKNIKWSSMSADIDIYFTTGLVNQKAISLKKGSVVTKVLRSSNQFLIFLNNEMVHSLTQIEVACSHAVGHALGFQHQLIPSLMSPLFSASTLTVDKCAVSITSASSFMQDGKSYFFQGSKFWRLSQQYTMDPGYPKHTNTRWINLPADFDEAFVWGLNWQTYFFKGNVYYRYDASTNRVDPRYPVLISRGWLGVPDDIDAAFSDKSRVTHFLKGDKVYRYDNTLDRVAPGYPKLIKHVFPKLPNDIDTAFRYYYDDEIYFFKGLNYYKWDENYNQVDGPYLIRNNWKNLCNV